MPFRELSHARWGRGLPFACLPLLLGALVGSCTTSEEPPTAQGDPAAAHQDPANPVAPDPAPSAANATHAMQAGSNSTRPNVVLITVDTLRADHTTVHGYEFDTTPRLKKVAEQGTRFRTAYAHTSTTLPSHTTLLTSLYPLAHGIVKNGYPLSPEHPILSEILAEQGYATAAFVSSYVLDDRFGLARGFATYDDDLTPRTQDPTAPRCARSKLERCADDTARRAARWVEEQPSGRSFFLWVHVFDPHAAYRPPHEFLQRVIGEPAATARPAPPESTPGKLAKLGLAFTRLWEKYDGEIAFADDAIGRILDALDAKGLSSNTLLVVTADHGEALGGHGVLTHGATLYEEVLHVPLLLRWPGRIAADREVEAPVGLIDVAPTILELAGVDASPLAFQGTSVAGAVLGTEPLDPERPIYLQRRNFTSRAVVGYPVKGDAFGLRRGRWKYTDSDARGREMYDLEADPKETKNLIDQMPERARDLAADLERWKEASRRAATDGTSRTISPEDKARLRALGYVE